MHLLNVVLSQLLTPGALSKFVFSKEAKKTDEIFTVNLTLTTTRCQIDSEDFVNFVAFLEKIKSILRFISTNVHFSTFEKLEEMGVWLRACLTIKEVGMLSSTDYGRPVRKPPSLHGRKSTPTPKFLGTAEGYFVWHISPKFQISLIYAFIKCP